MTSYGSTTYPQRFEIMCRGSASAYPINLRDLGAFGLRFSRHYRGGDKTATFNIPARGNEPNVAPQVFQAEYDIRLHDRQGCFWRGKITEMAFQETTEGRFWSITATGYATGLGEALDDAYRVDNKTLVQIITDAIALATSSWDESSISTGGYSTANAGAVYPNIHGTGAFKAGQLIAWASKFDEGAQWTIYAQDNGNRRFTYKPRPSSPSLYLRSSDFVNKDWGYSRSPLFNTVQVEYNRGGTVALPTYAYRTATDAVSAADFGARTLAIRMWELVSSTDGDEVAAAVLAVAKRPRMSATLFRTVAREGYGIMARRDLSPTGRTVPAHRILAGELARFMDVPQLDQVATTTDFNAIAMIAETEYDEESATLTLTPESMEDTTAGYLARFDAAAKGFLG